MEYFLVEIVLKSFMLLRMPRNFVEQLAIEMRYAFTSGENVVLHFAIARIN